MFDASSLAELRATEYGYLDENKHIYLDHTGAALPARRQLRAHADRTPRTDGLDPRRHC
ncbi:hypothetical protein SALBM311S_04611 [Streptomyces alboniger]